MTDIDFDELDRAVNSLVNPDNKPVPSTPAQAPVAPASVPVTSSSSSSSAPTPASAPLAERRSSGRFMDVVHPSSDMRSSVPPRTSSREAKTVTPPATPAVTNEQPQKQEATSWPDPIDMHEAAQAKTDVTPAAPVVDTPKESANNGPLESPFLSDAKVEKRPLGAFSTTSSDDNSSSPSTPSEPTPSVVPEPLDSTTAPTSEPEKTPEPGDQSTTNDTPMPAELQPGLLSIESNEDPKALEKEEIVPTGPTSITQQYTQQPSTGDKPVANMFDTSAYKKPQMVTGKKKSGWLVVLWIFLLLVIGGGIGAAVYFFVLPRL